jgi:glyoxylase-like metal-dependent hydrolase (beta-lactamase superfamily II)
MQGAGCNLALSVGDDGIVLVDSGYPQVAAAVRSELKKRYPDRKVRFILNTHEHMDHIGGNDVIGEGAPAIAHVGVQPALEKPNELFSDFSLPPPPEGQWPEITFDRQITLHMNGEEIKVIGLPAHSEGDSIVYFTKSKVLHMGDNYFPDTSPMLFPGPDLDSYFRTFGPFLESLPDDTTVLSGHAPPVTLAGLKSHYAKSEKLYRLVSQQLADKKSLEETISAADQEKYPARWTKYFYENLQKNATAKH